MRLIAKSYRLLVASVPPQFSGLLTSQTEGESHVQQEEISALLKEIGYIPIMLHEQRGSIQGISWCQRKEETDLLILYKCLRKRFSCSLLCLVHLHNWFTIELRDACFHVPVYPPHRKYLKFAFQGVAYECLILPFGLSFIPRALSVMGIELVDISYLSHLL